MTDRPLSSLTLFHTSQGWQLSTREAGETGWSVSFIQQSQVTELLALLGREPTLRAEAAFYGEPSAAQLARDIRRAAAPATTTPRTRHTVEAVEIEI
jgi:hypothetical protein